jgi:prolyl-tRNA synthetase
MRLSRFFLPILRETPKEAEIVSHRLMLRAGMIRQEGAGIYAFLPLGLRVLQKICKIIREEADVTRITARKCCASRTATSATCYTVPRTRK